MRLTLWLRSRRSSRLWRKASLAGPRLRSFRPVGSEQSPRSCPSLFNYQTSEPATEAQ